MSVSGLCSVCEAREAVAGCDNCGALVCRNHYDRSRGLCVECANAGGGRRVSDTGSDGPDDLTGAVNR